MKLAQSMALALLLCTAGASAQSLEPGKYNGMVRAPNNRNQATNYAFVVEITVVENGKLKGSIQSLRADAPCSNAAMQAEGTVAGNKVLFTAAEAALAQGCEKVWFQGMLDGANLEGGIHFNGISRKITLTK